jgi:C-terminal processing protease CtpA/Prc
MRRLITLSVITAVLAIFLAGCKKDEPVTKTKASEAVQAVNKWIFETLSDYYLWNYKMPADIDYAYEKDSEEYFNKLLYSDEDRFSYITSDYASLKAELGGVPVTMGFAPAFYLLSGKQVMIVVKYVYPGSAASEAGLERGDIILSINNTQLDTVNYYNLYSGNSYTVGLGAISGNTVTPTGESMAMTARVTNTDPSIYDTILDIGGYKIGYLAYTEFITGASDTYLTTMDDIFTKFKNAAISDLIVDLRYNPGGEVTAALHLASSIAPAAVVTAGETMIHLQYNDMLSDYLTQNYPDYLSYKFDNVSSNINMSHVFFLTTKGSASASELTIVGLRPYMNVTQIGEATYGKYVGSWVLPDDYEKWAMMPIVTRFSNADGYTNFKDGLTPDYLVKDDLFPAAPFGDPSDPMIAKAIELSTGKSMPAAKGATLSLPGMKELVPREALLKRNLVLPFTIKK